MGLNNKVRAFTDLVTWQNGHRLVLDIYKTTRSFPKEEMFGLVSQLRRAIISFTSNIAEGFSRQSAKDKVRFYVMAYGSLAEIQNQLLIARDIEYLTAEKYSSLLEQITPLYKMTNALIKSAESRQPKY